MRKLLSFSQILTFFVTSIILFACKKNDSIKYNPETSVQTNDYKFLNQRFKQFAIEIAPVLENRTARSIIINKAKLKFDEEYEVLIKDLFEDSRISSLVPIEKSNKLHDDLFKRSKEHLYPQIYIPHFQYKEDYPTAHKTEGDSLSEDPVLVFYSGDAAVDSASDNEVWPGYKIKEGQLTFFTMVDEKYANENEVWVFSINETVNTQGKIQPPCDIDPCGAGCPLPPEGCNGNTGGGTTGGPDDDPTDAPAQRVDFPDLGHNKTNFKIEFMRVRNPKEQWIGGATEIAIRAKLVCHNGRREGIPGAEKKEYTSDQYSNIRGQLVKKVKRKYFKTQDLLTVNYPMQRNWQNEYPSIDPVHFVYIMFERDNWPAQKNIAERYAPISPITNEPGAGAFNLNYRSAGAYDGSPYADFRFTNTLFLAESYYYAGSGLVENSDIAFTTAFFF